MSMPLRRFCTAVFALVAGLLLAAQAQAQDSGRALGAGDRAFLDAREAFRLNDRERLAAHAARLDGHPLASYAEFWQIVLRLRGGDAERADADAAAFIERHRGTYIADRLRMEWLLSLGARRQFADYEREAAQQIWTHDEQQVRCYRMLARYLRNEGRRIAELADEARQTLLTTREAGGDGCMALTETLLADGRLDPWERIRELVEKNQLATAKRLAALAPGVDARQVAQAIDRPAAWLALHERRLTGAQREIALIALARLARDDPAQAATHANALHLHLTPQQRGIVWGRIGHMAAVKLMPEAVPWYRRGGTWVGTAPNTARADEVLEWQVRAALRGDSRGPDWSMVREAIERMPADLQRDPAWIYWRARALGADRREAEAQSLLRSLAGGHHFYARLAAEELGEPLALPSAAAAPAEEEVARFAANEGIARALKLIELGLRGDGNREWNWQTRGMDDRQLLALAEFARRQGVLDRMISTAERTREQHDFALRFPAPHRDELAPQARAAGLDETWIYGLIRQESRFIADARSSAGALGLMQLMPATARYVARRVGMSDFRPARITDLDVNLRLGTHYLRFVLDDLDGQPVLATAAYNAGPSRPRAWRATLQRPVEGAIFAETIPFNETRDYVKKVMANAVVYAAVFGDKGQSLKARLGTVTPKAAGSTDLP